MNQPSLQQLSEEYQDYFSISHRININVCPYGDISTPLPTEAEFLAAIPEPFLLASDVGGLNHSALRSLNKLGELAEELANYLQHQARKIDLLLHYILQQYDAPETRYHTVSFGGSGCCYLSDIQLAPLQVVELKIFLEDNAGAFFCYGQVLSCEESAGQWQIKVVFKRIRDEDRELIVRATLHQQSRQLKLKAEQRQQQTS